MNKRFCEYDFQTGFVSPGGENAISDVAGVRVGHFTKVEDDDIRTGITIIDPGVPNLFQNKIPCAIAVGNGFGKLVGVTQVEELGTLEAPIALTSTHAVGAVTQGIIDVVLQNTSGIHPQESINVVVGECNDGFLNDIHRSSLAREDVKNAHEALSADVGIGNVGAGTGTRAFSWKGGIGTASRRVVCGRAPYALGVLTQTNFGGALEILGVPVGRILGKTDFETFLAQDDGSCMIVIATNAPLSARQLKRIAGRAFLGLARTGSVMSHGSGDYAIAFTTSRKGLEGSGQTGSCIADSDLTPFFLATVEAVQESVYDALFAADTMQGRNGNVLEAIPVSKVVPLLRQRL